MQGLPRGTCHLFHLPYGWPAHRLGRFRYLNRFCSAPDKIITHLRCSAILFAERTGKAMLESMFNSIQADLARCSGPRAQHCWIDERLAKYFECDLCSRDSIYRSIDRPEESSR